MSYTISVPARVGEFVQKRYAEDLYDETPVWWPLQRDVESHPKAKDFVGSDEDLLNFLRMFFTDKVVTCVSSTLHATRNSWLGSSYCKRGTYSTYVHRLILEIGFALGDETASALEADRSAPVLVRFQVLGAAVGAVEEDMEGRATGHTQAPREGGGGVRRRPEYYGMGPDNVGGDQDNPGEYGDGLWGQWKFRSAPVHLVRLSSRSAPSKRLNPTFTDGCRSPRIADMSKEFIRHHLIRQFPHQQYDPSLVAGEQPHAFLFHGTRWSQIANFCAAGIDPLGARSEFAEEEAFYVTNCVRTAYEHPLHNRVLANHRQDSIAILCFKVPTAVLHGDIPTSRGNTFSVRYIGTSMPNWEEYWQQFCQSNLHFIPGALYYETRDIVTGPISLPVASQAENANLGILHRDGKYPQQLAFTSRAGRAWLAHHLVCIYREYRE